MRLGQLARKYDVSTQEIISYLKKIDPTNGIIHPNAKLDEHTEQLVAKHFDVLIDPNQEPVIDLLDDEENYVEEVMVDSPISEPEEHIPPVMEVVIEKIPTKEETTAPEPKEEETITTDRLLELMESEDTPVDLSKITRIKAAKRELEGLKVLGKIDLPEPKQRIQEKEVDTSDKRNKAKKKDRNDQPQVSAEEAEKRRLWAKQKKEENDLRLERKRKEKEKLELKAMKEAHYKQKVQRLQPKQQKNKPRNQEVENTAIATEIENSPQPKTVLGKIWRWLNT